VTAAFYITAVVALVAAVRVVSLRNAVHALMHLVLAIFAVAVMFYLLGAPLLAMIEVIVYAGAIVMLFLFVVMMIAPGPGSLERERTRLHPRAWVVPLVLGLALALETAWLILQLPGAAATGPAQAARPVAAALYRDYLLGVELSSILLLVGMIGAIYLGLRDGSGGGKEERSDG
jgi:NADH-quinone oxidoreductase subunit J